MAKNAYKWFFLALIWLFPLISKSQEVLTDSVPEHEKIYAKALKLLDSAKYQDAIPIFKNAIKEKKDYWQAYNKMAYCKIKLKDYKGAEKDLKKAELIMPINFETTKQGQLAALPTSNTGIMFGWSNFAAALASYRNSSTCSECWAMLYRGTLIATARIN